MGDILMIKIKEIQSDSRKKGGGENDGTYDFSSMNEYALKKE